MVRANGQILLGVNGTIPGTCTFWGYSLYINTDNGTDADNPMFSSLLTFLNQKKKVHLGLTLSAVSGTDHTNGCTSTSPSVIKNVRATFNPNDYGPDEVIPVGDEFVQ